MPGRASSCCGVRAGIRGWGPDVSVPTTCHITGRAGGRDSRSRPPAATRVVGWLLNAALHESLEEWGEQVKRDLADIGPAATPQERFELIWTRVIESISANRPLWIIQFEMLVQAQYADELREPLVASVTEGRLGLAGLFAGIDATADRRKAWLVGSVYQSLLVGMVVQWLLDPDHALSGRDLADALRMLKLDLG